MFITAASPPKDGCYASEHAADIYRATYHSAIKCSPHFAWYSEVLNTKDMHIWGCLVLVPGHNLKKSQDLALGGKFYGFTKTRSLIRWLDVDNDNIKHSHGARFLEIDRLRHNRSIGQ
jgi:hypothetical protein